MYEMDSIWKMVKDYFSGNSKALRFIRMDYSRDSDRKLNFNAIRKFFDMSVKGDHMLDDQSWADLDMDKVYGKLNGTYSSPGEQALYLLLRNPLLDETKLVARHRQLELFKNDKMLRERLLCIFFKLSRNHYNSFLVMIDKPLRVDKTKYYLYTLLGKVLPAASILLSIFVMPQFLLLLGIISFINTAINIRETKQINSNGISYLRDLIKSARKLAKTDCDELAELTQHIRSILDQIKDIEKSTRFIGFENIFGGVLEPISGAMLLQESSYYSISDRINEKRELLMQLYGCIGEIEAVISVAEYQRKCETPFVTPKFIPGVSLKILDGVHPLLEDAVPNSIHIQNHDIVLTGTNMSGKSTFLRMLGVNMLLAQTFYFAHASEYEACMFHIVSSISPNDDLSSGKSFFMAEVESLHRIIRALDNDTPVFCPIDEIFRGTNPVERIAMSAEILLYLYEHRTITIVATHDRELAEILKEKFVFYYFSENVDNESGLSFDYKLKTGISQTRNAIKLLEYCGYPPIITNSAIKRAEGIEGFL